MSGSGGGGGDWRPEPKEVARPKPGKQGDESGGGGASPDPCNITEVTNLNSVNRTAVAGLRPRDELDIVFQSGPPQRLVAQTQAGTVVGSITSTSMLQIIQCIQAGYTYVAVVLSVRGAQCQVRIEPK